MKKSKIFWLVALLVMSVVAVEAQERPNGEGKNHGKCPNPTEMAEKRMECMSKMLDLTPEQRVEIEKLHQQRAERMAENRAAHKAEMEQMKKILTPEQYAKLEAGMKKMKPGEHRRGHGPRKGPHMMKGDSMKGCCKMADKEGPCCKKGDADGCKNLKGDKPCCKQKKMVD